MAVQLTSVGQKVFNDRYALRDSETGQQIETTVEQMWDRVATAIADIETTKENKRKWRAGFRNLLQDFKFVPAGRILSGAGTGFQVTYFNCYVIPSPEDSRGGIMKSLAEWIEIQARAGGVGMNFSTLRPRGSYIKTVNGTSSGPVPWMELFSVATGDVVQQGGSRRGAAMIMLDDDHPDIEEFIKSKTIDPRTNQPQMLEHANISVAVSDEFMQTLAEDGDWELKWPTAAMVRAVVQSNTLNQLPKQKVYKTVPARDIWKLICEQAWQSAEPGIIFIDRYNKMSNTWYYEDIRCTNPCGEQGLPPYGVCNLGALNLSAYVKGERFDFDQFTQDVSTAMRFLDNVIDANFYFIPQNKEAQLGTRRTGLGTMGLADALIKMKIPYASQESLVFIKRVHQILRDEAYLTSAFLAKEKGKAPHYDERFLEGKFIERLPSHVFNEIKRNGIRNIVLLTQAPTGSTSLLADASSGIEPNFSFAHIRQDRTGKSIIYHTLMEQFKQENGADADVPSYFVTANDLLPEDHIAVQAAIQYYCDSSISKTVNAPNDHTPAEVDKLYRLAFSEGCKGVTYYRTGSRDAVLTEIKKEKEEPKVTAPATSAVKTRPEVLHGYTRKTKAPEGTVNITINSDNEGPLEIFVNIGKAGSDIAGFAEGVGRLLSYTLKMDSSTPRSQRLNEMAEQLKGISGSRSTGFGPNKVVSFLDAIGKSLEKHNAPAPTVQELAQEVLDNVVQPALELLNEADICPECGNSSLVNQEGCKKCFDCGYAEC